MKTRTLLLTAVTLGALTVGIAGASPLKLKTEGTKSQTVTMCADCKAKVTCAQVGDYIVGLVVDQENPKLGTGNLVVHVKNAAKEPVKDAKVVVNLTMPEHKHALKPFTLKHDAHGKYFTTIKDLKMPGAWKAEVAVTPANGDTVKQVFTFAL